jgi:glucose-6-phosphate isomerase
MIERGVRERRTANMVERLTLDIGRCLVEVERPGLTQEMLDSFSSRLEGARKAVLGAAGQGMMGWMDLPQQDLTPLLTYEAERRGRYESLLAIGIGGSALGITVLATALLPFYYNELSTSGRGFRPRLYVLDNVDPDETAALLERLDLDRTLVNVISKSGTTGESMSSYLVVRRRLEAALGAAAAKDHLVFTTDPGTGTLRRIGDSDGIRTFDLPSSVGGRFSVLTPVGLLPAVLTGMDVPGLVTGAGDMADWIESASGWDNPACAFAGAQYLEDTQLGRGTSVMMPYSARLRDVADWYRQLWAESLGKEVDREGKTVHTGPLPVKGLGVTDQHSQLQLYAEGPDNKVITFLGVREFAHSVTIPAPGGGAESLAYLSGHTLGELMAAEQRSTAWALGQKGRPSLTITLPRVDAFSVGALLYLLEFATAISGELYNIDAFNQPGVELSKQATYALMGRPGFEQLAGKID